MDIIRSVRDHSLVGLHSVMSCVTTLKGTTKNSPWPWYALQAKCKAKEQALLAAARAERAAAEAAVRADAEGRLSAAAAQHRLLREQLQEALGALKEHDSALQVNPQRHGWCWKTRLIPMHA